LGYAHYEAWGNVLHTVRTGESAFENRFGGMSAVEYFSKPENEKNAQLFQKYISSVTELLNDRVAASYDWSNFKKLIDIGGGQGALVNAVISVNKNIQAVVFDHDEPEPEPEHEPELVSSDEKGEGGPQLRDSKRRITFVEGDFFEGVPEGGDIYTIKWILHDWDDDKCGVILDNIHNAIEKSSHSRLLVLEPIVKPIGGPISNEETIDFAALMDTNMMTILGGKERTEEEFRTLLGCHGFSFLRSIMIHPFLNIVEAKVDASFKRLSSTK